ncbi:SH3 domain-containing protein [Devosia sp.]|uniref:SH3 domain-containing protein n=1 Tax=Devosia sp. TaxID=1871048 RepID=UPI003A959C3C
MAALVALVPVSTGSVPVALGADTPSGLPLPRFVTTRSDPINVRVGPGTKYSVAWVYVKAGVPVEIIQEFDTWRKIRDADGSEGWLHQNLLQGKRTAVVTPTAAAGNAPVALRSGRSGDASVRAWLTPGYVVELKACDGSWCEASASYTPEGGSKQTYAGWIAQAELWGVYADEEFD